MSADVKVSSTDSVQEQISVSTIHKGSPNEVSTNIKEEPKELSEDYSKNIISSEGITKSQVEDKPVGGVSFKEFDKLTPNSYLGKARSFKCALCYYATNIKENLEVHLLTHQKWKGAQFEEDLLTNHLSKNRLLKPEDFKCSKCPYKTKIEGHFYNHQLKHKSSKDLKCSMCDYKANNTRSLTMHMRKHNCVEFSCSHCNYATNNKYTFNKHMLTHGSKDLKCGQCDYVTNTYPNLKSHQLKHSKELRCGWCNYATNTKTNLRQHLRTRKCQKRSQELGDE